MSRMWPPSQPPHPWVKCCVQVSHKPERVPRWKEFGCKSLVAVWSNLVSCCTGEIKHVPVWQQNETGLYPPCCFLLNFSPLSLESRISRQFPFNVSKAYIWVTAGLWMQAATAADVNVGQETVIAAGEWGAHLWQEPLTSVSWEMFSAAYHPDPREWMLSFQRALTAAHFMDYCPLYSWGLQILSSATAAGHQPLQSTSSSRNNSSVKISKVLPLMWHLGCMKESKL